MPEPDPYNLATVTDRVTAARTSDAGVLYLAGLEKAYKARRAARRKRGLPALCFLGHGRCGKDTAARYAAAAMGAHYGGASSEILLWFVARATGLAPDVAWRERHGHREFWVAAGHAARGEDYACLARANLGRGDVAAGIRGDIELHAAVQTGVIDLAVWVERPGVPADPTVEFGAADCDVTIYNDGSLTAFYRRLDRLVAFATRAGRAATEENDHG